MKRVIRAHFSKPPVKTKYTVHWLSPDGHDCVLAGANTIEKAAEYGIEQAHELIESPFETDKRKLLFLENMYVYDEQTGNVVDSELDDYTDGCMSELDSRIRMKNKNEYSVRTR